MKFTCTKCKAIHLWINGSRLERGNKVGKGIQEEMRCPPQVLSGFDDWKKNKNGAVRIQLFWEMMAGTSDGYEPENSVWFVVYGMASL